MGIGINKIFQRTIVNTILRIGIQTNLFSPGASWAPKTK